MNLQYAFIGKFSYDKPNIDELRRVIQSQYGIKSSWITGVLDTRHILLRLSTLEDYEHILSTKAFCVKTKDMY